MRVWKLQSKECAGKGMVLLCSVRVYEKINLNCYLSPKASKRSLLIGWLFFPNTVASNANRAADTFISSLRRVSEVVIGMSISLPFQNGRSQLQLRKEVSFSHR